MSKKEVIGFVLVLSGIIMFGMLVVSQFHLYPEASTSTTMVNNDPYTMPCDQLHHAILSMQTSIQNGDHAADHNGIYGSLLDEYTQVYDLRLMNAWSSTWNSYSWSCPYP